MGYVPLQGTGRFLAVSDNQGTPNDPMVPLLSLPQGEDESSLSIAFPDYKAVPIFGTGKMFLCMGAGTPEDPYQPVVYVDNLPVGIVTQTLNVTGSGQHPTFTDATANDFTLLIGNGVTTTTPNLPAGQEGQVARLTIDNGLNASNLTVNGGGTAVGYVAILVPAHVSFTVAFTYNVDLASWQISPLNADNGLIKSDSLGCLKSVHFSGNVSAPAPTIAAGAALGSGGSLAVTITGPGGSGQASDSAGQVSLTCGTGPGSGVAATITFGTVFASPPIVVICGANSANWVITQAYVSSITTAHFVISYAVSPSTSNQNETYNYIALSPNG